MPTKIQKAFSNVYAGSFLIEAQYVNSIASTVLKIQTNINGLAGPNQDTKLKLMILIMTPTISI